MQRWMLYAGLAAFGLVLLAGGAYFARKEYYASKPAPIWVPIVLRADISKEEQETLAEQIDEKLREDDLVRKIVIDAKLQEGFGVPSEEEAVEELKRRMFVKAGRADIPQGGSVPSINVGVDGKQRDKEVSKRIATRMIRDVWIMIGFDPDTGEPLNAAPTISPGEY